MNERPARVRQPAIDPAGVGGDLSVGLDRTTRRERGRDHLLAELVEAGTHQGALEEHEVARDKVAGGAHRSLDSADIGSDPRIVAFPGVASRRMDLFMIHYLFFRDLDQDGCDCLRVARSAFPRRRRLATRESRREQRALAHAPTAGHRDPASAAIPGEETIGREQQRSATYQTFAALPLLDDGVGPIAGHHAHGW